MLTFEQLTQTMKNMIFHRYNSTLGKTFQIWRWPGGEILGFLNGGMKTLPKSFGAIWNQQEEATCA